MTVAVYWAVNPQHNNNFFNDCSAPGVFIRINTVICFYSYIIEAVLKISDYLFEPILLKAEYP